MNPPGHGQLIVCPLQAEETEQEAPGREPAVIRSPSESPAYRCCCGISPLGVRGLAQAWLQGGWVGNPAWVLWCLSWPLPGTQTHMDTHTQISDTCRHGPTSASEHN